MSKIFRLYKGGTNTYQGWNDSPAFPYNSTSRDTIEDPDGASAKHEITSIPSPFARIDLVKTAFKEVCNQGNKKKVDLDGKTIFHKMVSDTLDVGEIFFNIDKYKDKIEIITWDAARSIEMLMNDDNPSHKCYADALNKYLQSDARTYNFGQLKNVYLLNYVNGRDELNIIGATSPATLFFSTANKIDYVKDVYFSDADKPFDDEYQPLYKRDRDYIKTWFTLRKVIPDFSTLFPEINTYLEYTYRELTDSDFKRALSNLGEANTSDFETINVRSLQQSNNVEVLGFNLLKKKQTVVSSVSEFTIKPSVKNIEDNLPLVLPVESGNNYSDMLYTTGKWGTTNAAPYKDKEDNYTKRVLPFDGSRSPYLTISDFLEDTLIRVPHTLNKHNFFDGNIVIDAPKLSYLLPIKPMLFKFFTINDVVNGLADGQPLIEMDTLAGGSVKAVLRIPIKGNRNTKFVEYSRIYYNGRKADEEKNEGGINVFDFTGLIMPMVRFSNPAADAYYSVSCVSTFSRMYQYVFYLGDNMLAQTSKVCRNEDGTYTYKSDNYALKHTNFDYIQVKDRNGNSGIILPLLKQQRSINIFEFAVDLGTSNTHIEYKKQRNTKSLPFDFDEQDILACQFFKQSLNFSGREDDLIDETELIRKDFLPSQVGHGDFKFPTRTTLSCAKMIDWTNTQEPFGLCNIPLTYDKRMDMIYNNIHYNLKWGNGADQSAMEAYVECLMLMLRNKVLLNDGDLSKTKVTWFYPISMAPKRIQKLRSTWDSMYGKYFSNEAATTAITESAAPIVYYFSRYATATNLINIDMGGGTTDVAFAKNKEIQYVTSFKYATNVLFEDSFSELNLNNGIIDWHKNNILRLLEEKDINELVAIFKSQNNSQPANMASFLFSLKENSLIKDAKVSDKSVDFNALLRDDENFKIVFILYYVAIIYHIASIVKVKGLEVPRHIAFSGNGSKVINIITTDHTLLARLTKCVFEHVLGHKYSSELEILGLDNDSNPKESTCKGGIIGTTDNTTLDNVIILKGDCSAIVDKSKTYNDLNDADLEKTVQSVKDFFKFALYTLEERIDYDNCFGVTQDSINIAKEICQKDLLTYLNKGIAQRKDSTNGKNKIEETTFFYPVKGVINALSQAIYDNLTSHE